MGHRVGALTICAILFTGTACVQSGCTDDYNPTSSSSCSYNPELAGLAESRDANVAELPVPEEMGGGHVYLVISPRQVSSDERPSITILNRSSVGVGYGSSFALHRADGSFGKDLAKNCAFTGELRILEPKAESGPTEIGPCTDQPLERGTYEVTKDLILAVGVEEISREVTAPFRVTGN